MSNLKEKIVKLKAQIKYFPKTIVLIWKASKTLVIIWAILLVLLGLLPAFQIYLIKPLVDGLSSNPNNLPTNLYLPLILLGGTLLLTPILSSLLTYIRTLQSEKVQNSIRKKIQDKVISLDMKHFEDSNYYNKLHRAHIDAISKPTALLENIGIFFQNFLTLIAILFILLPMGLWIPFVLILSSIPSLFVALKYTFKLHNHRVSNTTKERKLNYFNHLLTNNETASEVKTFNLGAYFKKEYWKIKHKIQSTYFDILKAQLKAEIVSSIFVFLILVLVMLYIVYETINGKYTIGMLVMFYSAFIQGQKIIKTLFGNINELYKNLTFLENLFDFFAIKNEKENYLYKLSNNEINNIKIENISFKYPKSENFAIKNLSLNLEINKITAIVGTNGSGKTTLIKLLNAFYYPTSGNIFINNKDITTIEPKSIRKNITILFQNFLKYHLKVNDNIQLGDTTKIKDTTQLEEIATMSGIEDVIKELPNKYETVLGKWFGGIELSGGEWQKLALARAYLKNSKVIILDEPTSAFDSWAEAKWLNRFKNLCKDKTALIITHRFTTAKYADIIHVMNKGKIIESGTHNQLLELNGIYAQSWYNQTKEHKENSDWKN